jgi:dihydrolipoamide dehydrogenase
MRETAVPDPTNHADVAVLGGGSAGYAAALRCAQLGRSVVLVEADAVGGTCLHRGCVPTKALLRVGEVADMTRSAARYGLRTQLDGIDMAAVNAFKDSVVDRFHSGLRHLLQACGITVLQGYGRLAGPTTVRVEDQCISAGAIILATGSEPKTLPHITIGGRVLTSDEALTLDTVPGSVAVLGGGVIGVEFASLWASLGASVTVIESLPRLLPSEDVDSSRALARAFRRRKIHTRTGTTVRTVEQGSADVRITFDTGDPLIVDYLLVAIGRRPRTSDLGLETAGVVLDHGFVKTDQRLQTSQPGIYAVGDIVAGAQLAHRGFAHGLFVADELAGLRPAPIDDDALPRVVYSHPEVASIGMTEETARERYGDSVQVARHDLAGNAKSHILDTAGAVKVVGHTDGRVLGIHMVGDRVGELIGEAQLLHNLGATAATAASIIHAHPSQSEAIGEAFLALAGRPLHGHSREEASRAGR